ncbi:MAG: hypothetical protein ACTSYI_15540 [Promethearchaeota archaeon]
MWFVGGGVLISTIYMFIKQIEKKKNPEENLVKNADDYFSFEEFQASHPVKDKKKSIPDLPEQDPFKFEPDEPRLG